MWQTLWLWFIAHQTDLQSILKDLQELRTTVATSGLPLDKVDAVNNKLALTMQKIEIASTRADAIHGDMKGKVEIDPQNQEQHDQLNAELEASKQTTEEAKSDVIPLDTSNAGASTIGENAGSGTGSGDSNCSGYVPATSLEVQGGTITVGSNVARIDGAGPASMKVVAMRQNEAGAREVAAEWTDELGTRSGPFSASDLKKV